MITTRFRDIVSNLHEYTYHILGCGAIGTSTATQLVRMGGENFHSINPDVNVIKLNKEFDEFYYTGDNDIAILGFDSMSVRLDAVQTMCKTKQKPILIIDGRMGAEQFQQYMIDKPTEAKYKQVWYSDEEGSPEPCTSKATSYCSNMSGSFIVNSIRKYVTKQPYDKKIIFNFPTLFLGK